MITLGKTHTINGVLIFHNDFGGEIEVNSLRKLSLYKLQEGTNDRYVALEQKS